MEITFSMVLGNMKINLDPFITLGRSHIPPLYKWSLVRS